MHERGVRVGLRHAVAVAYLLELVVILGEFVAALLQFLYLFLLLTANYLQLFVRRLRRRCQCVFQCSDKLSHRLGSGLNDLGLSRFVLYDFLVYLLQKDAHFLLQLRPVLFTGLAPY